MLRHSALSLARAVRPVRAHQRLLSTAAAAADVAAAAVRHDIRNVAIVAHVDHGKTTLVDALLQHTKAVDTAIGKDDRLMDGNDQERERGITILAKNTAVTWKDTKINIVDTPGHADFGGEVERVLNMVDGVLLIVDAADGPKPQTRFVLKKAIAMGHKILVVLNKIDKPTAQPGIVTDKTFDLFCELGASDEQTDFEIVYTSAINRQSGREPEVADGMDALLDAILDLPKPIASVEDPLQLQISNLGADPYIGRLAVGRIRSGTLRRQQQIGLCAGPGEPITPVKTAEVFMYDGMGRVPVEEASAGDIVVVAGVSEFNIGDTLVDPADPRPLPPIVIEQPTMSITMGVNKSPYAGRSKTSKHLTSSKIRERLDHELQTNVALQLRDGSDTDSVQVYGRGLLHLTVLIENMRREGFELQVGPPAVLFGEGEGGEQTEPFELVEIELPEENSGSVIDLLAQRKGNLLDMGAPNADGMQVIQYEVPTRGMVGVKTKVLNATRGLGVMTSTFAGYKPYAGDFGGRTRGNLLSTETGTANNHGLDKAQTRGQLFVKHNDDVFKDQIVGIHSSGGDLSVNVCRKKELTNIRASGKEDGYNIYPPTVYTLEEAVEYVIDGEFVEITPEHIRMGVHHKVGKSGKVVK